jgi:hypothetical protein
MSRRGIRRQARVVQPSPVAIATDTSLLDEFRAKSAPTSNLKSNAYTVEDQAAFTELSGSVATMQRADARMPRVPQNVSAELASLKAKVEQCASKVANWHQVLTEITQSVFILVATCTVSNVPYYADIPENDRALASPVGRLESGRKVTLLYPQLVRNNMIYMRLRLVDQHSGDVQMYYVPIANQSLTQTQLARTVGINSTADQYFDWFHSPGETDPAPADDGSE